MDQDSDDLVVRTIREHASALLRTARRHSLCADDAHDAYQRALEIFLRRASTLEAATAVRWLHVVVKHEAQAVRRARLETVAAEDVDLDRCAADALPDADERVLRFDRLMRSAEALARLKPQEVRALWLKAQGHSYAEIARETGWTYTKVNRCLAEGRRAFLDRYAGIEAGRECERWAPVVSALVDGEATADQLAAARPHLRRCAGCRATVRELRLAGPRLAGALPVAGLVGAAGHPDPGRLEGLLRAAEGAVVAVHERVSAWVLKVQGAAEAASATKVAAVAASAAAIAGGGAVTVRHVAALGGGGHGRHAARAKQLAPASAAAATAAATSVPGPAAGAEPAAATAAAPRSPAGEFAAARRRGGEFGAPGGRAGAAGEFSDRVTATAAVAARPGAASGVAAAEPSSPVVEPATPAGRAGADAPSAVVGAAGARRPASAVPSAVVEPAGPSRPAAAAASAVESRQPAPAPADVVESPRSGGGGGEFGVG